MTKKTFKVCVLNESPFPVEFPRTPRSGCYQHPPPTRRQWETRGYNARMLEARVLCVRVVPLPAALVFIEGGRRLRSDLSPKLSKMELVGFLETAKSKKLKQLKVLLGLMPEVPGNGSSIASRARRLRLRAVILAARHAHPQPSGCAAPPKPKCMNTMRKP